MRCMADFNIAVWGLGPHAINNVLPAISAVPGLHLFGVCSRNSEVVSSISAQYSCIGWTDADQLLANPTVDGVFISTPAGLHAAQGKSVLDAGKHFWCDKPLADSVDEAELLIALSHAAGVTLAEGFMYLHHPHFRDLKRLVASGQLGEVHTVTCRFGIPPLARPGYRNTPELGGGAFLDVGVYPISATVALFPPLDFTVTFAEILSEPGSPVDTEGRALLRTQAPGSALLEWRTGCAYRNEIDIWGTEGSVFTERIFSKPAAYVPSFRILDARGVARYACSTAADHFALMFGAFLRLVGNDHLAELERYSIARRARLISTIQDYCSKGSSGNG